jgi:hypothetical protein
MLRFFSLSVISHQKGEFMLEPENNINAKGF